MMNMVVVDDVLFVHILGARTVSAKQNAYRHDPVNRQLARDLDQMLRVRLRVREERCLLNQSEIQRPAG